MAYDEQATHYKWGHELVVAIGFLTVLPVPVVTFYEGLLGRAGRWFPLVGLGIGLTLSGGHWLFSAFFPPLLAAALTTVLWIGLTGGLHLDGVADCCDGLFAPVTPERRLSIMHDPRTGAFAVMGLVLLLLLKTASIAALPQAHSMLLLGPTWARWLLLWSARQPAARSDGMGAEFRSSLTTKNLYLASVTPLLLAILFLQRPGQLLCALISSSTVTWLITHSARHRLGGMTGDVYGLVVELSELTVLLIFAAQITQ